MLVEQQHVCPKCGLEVEGLPVLMPISRQPGPAQAKAERVHATILGRPTAKTLSCVQYRGVFLPDAQLAVPTHEGFISDGHVVDAHGDPELMTSFAEQYLSAYRTLMPAGRLPTSVVEVMPALHTLVVAAELAIKADLIRSGRKREDIEGHSLPDLFGKLDGSHRREVRKRFAKCELNVLLTAMGESPQPIKGILTCYSRSPSSGSSVYLDTRYHAEPGPGGKAGMTMYPIFLPYAVEILIETFRFFSGAARLGRRGAAVSRCAHSGADGDHGDWSLVPSSLGLVVVQVPQNARVDTRHDELPEFRRWKEARPPGFSASWMYGGSELLFYRLDEGAPDSLRIGGIECKVRRDDDLGMHSRDLYQLADALDAGFTSNALRI